MIGQPKAPKEFSPETGAHIATAQDKRFAAERKATGKKATGKMSAAG